MAEELWQITIISLQVATLATVVVLFLSIFLAFIFTHTTSKTLKLLELLIYVPMAMPPVALGYSLLLMLGPHSFLGSFFKERLGISLAFSFVGAVIASIAVCLGIGVRCLRNGFEAIHKEQSHIAALCGATPWQIFYHILLPQCKNTLLYAGILVFIRALSEFGATIILAGNSLGSTRTLALAIWVGMETPGKERECLILVTVSVFIALIALTASEILLRTNKFNRED